MEGLNRVPREEHEPNETKADIERVLSVLSPEAIALYSTLPLVSTPEEYEQALERFNAMGAAQLDREDEVRRETLENESLEERQMETVITLPPYGRTLRITRAKNGVVTLASS